MLFPGSNAWSIPADITRMATVVWHRKLKSSPPVPAILRKLTALPFHPGDNEKTGIRIPVFLVIQFNDILIRKHVIVVYSLAVKLCRTPNLSCSQVVSDIFVHQFRQLGNGAMRG